MTHQQQTASTIASHRTAGRATVTLTDDSHLGRITITCTGCTWNTHKTLNNRTDDTPEQTAQHIADALPAASETAQAHARTCTALPKTHTEH